MPERYEKTAPHLDEPPYAERHVRWRCAARVYKTRNWLKDGRSPSAVGKQVPAANRQVPPALQDAGGEDLLKGNDKLSGT